MPAIALISWPEKTDLTSVIQLLQQTLTLSSKRFNPPPDTIHHELLNSYLSLHGNAVMSLLRLIHIKHLKVDTNGMGLSLRWAHQACWMPLRGSVFSRATWYGFPPPLKNPGFENTFTLRTYTDKWILCPGALAQSSYEHHTNHTHTHNVAVYSNLSAVKQLSGWSPWTQSVELVTALLRDM